MKLGVFLVFLCCWLNPLFCAVDVYVFNVGQGNFIWVSMDITEGENTGLKKVLIVDCCVGRGNGWMDRSSFGQNLNQKFSSGILSFHR